ncbi:MAG: flavodoxin domain-containing protein [Tissierellia bacterium]|jgi:flavodoxin|nr:flavodoxin domain-containing protein [Tissierellia bacterium]
MKIGIIVHSKTGNTLHVAQKIMGKLKSDGHLVSIEQIIADNDSEIDIKKISLINIPNVSEYDALIFGAPVRGFSLSPIMQAYLTNCAAFNGKKVSCFVTQHFPYPWMGGNRAIEQMKNLCESKDTKMICSSVVNWKNKKRDKMIAETVKKLCDIKS